MFNIEAITTKAQDYLPLGALVESVEPYYENVELATGSTRKSARMEVTYRFKGEIYKTVLKAVITRKKYNRAS